MSLIRGGRCEQLSYQAGSKAFNAFRCSLSVLIAGGWGEKKVYLQEDAFVCAEAETTS